MWLLHLAWKNLWRNRNRTIITMAAIFFAVMLSVFTTSLKNGIFENLIQNMVNYYSGYIQIHKNGYWDEQQLENSFVINDFYKKDVFRHSNVLDYTHRLESFALASSGENTKGCLVIGIDPSKEDLITNLSTRIIEGKYIDENSKGVLIAEGLLKKMKVSLGDTIVLLGQGYHGSTAAGKYSVAGVLHFGSPELNDRVVYMPILLAQELYGAIDLATSMVVSIRNTETLQVTALSLKNKLGNEYEVMTWEEMMPDIKQHISADTDNMLVVQMILYLLISFGIFGTLLMMVAERRFEFGMLLAIGMKKSKLAFLLLLESILTVVFGCLLGLLTSLPLVVYFNQNPIRITGDLAKAYERFGFEAIFPTSLHAENFVNQGVIVFLIGLILSFYPVLKIWQMNPVEAMRK